MELQLELHPRSVKSLSTPSNEAEQTLKALSQLYPDQVVLPSLNVMDWHWRFNTQTRSSNFRRHALIHPLLIAMSVELKFAHTLLMESAATMRLCDICPFDIRLQPQDARVTY